LWIAGDGPLRARLERMARGLGIEERVAFLGWRDDVPALMAHADLLVCPSLHEPLGNVLIEAWSAGLPVVATASDGPAGLIRDGETGLLVPLPQQRGGGPLALALAIERLCGDAAPARRSPRAELRGERPIAFSTQSDCEPPLHLFRRHGLDFTRHLRGMYAIALYDPASDDLGVLRRWVAERVPQAQPLARKHGFTVPVAQWIGLR
jgi:hypothetical protein